MKHRLRKQLPPYHPPRTVGYTDRVVTAATVLLHGERHQAQMVVAHELGCARPKGGACSCRPDITVELDDGRVADVLMDGSVSAPTRAS